MGRRGAAPAARGDRRGRALDAARATVPASLVVRASTAPPRWTPASVERRRTAPISAACSLAAPRRSASRRCTTRRHPISARWSHGRRAACLTTSSVSVNMPRHGGVDAVRRRCRLRHAFRPRGGRPRPVTARSSVPRSATYPHAVIERDAARRPASGCAPAWALQDPEDYREVLRIAVPEAVRAAGRGPGGDRRHRHRLHGLDADAGPARRHAAVRGRRASASARTPTRSCGSTTRRRPRPSASRELAAERGEPWLARYGGRISSEWEFAKALQVLDEEPEVYDGDRALDRGRRLDRLGALRARDPQRLHRGLQGHPPGRRVPVAATTSPRSTSASPASSPTSSSTRSSPLGARAGGLTARGRAAGPGSPRASRSRSATSTRT